MAIIDIMGLAGVAINDSIVVLVAVRGNEAASRGDARAVREVVTRSTRHVVVTSLATTAGFIPLLLPGGGFWPPLAIAIAGGVGGANLLALYSSPSVYVLTMGQGGDLGEADKQLESPIHFDAKPERCRVYLTQGSFELGNSFPLSLGKSPSFVREILFMRSSSLIVRGTW